MIGELLMSPFAVHKVCPTRFLELCKELVDQRHVRMWAGPVAVAQATEVYRRPGKSSRHCRLDKSRRDIGRQASMGVQSIETSAST